MAGSYTTDITHFLDEEGNLISAPAQARRLAEHLTAIIVMASFPDPELPPEYQAYCHRRPNRKPCKTGLLGFVLPDSDTIAWLCPRCGHNGLITGWRGTMWDMSAAEVAH